MSDRNTRCFRGDLGRTGRRYLATKLTISPRLPELGRIFQNLLREEELVRGPCVETLPDFEKGASLAKLVAEEALSKPW